MSNVRVKPPQAAQKAAAHALEVRASVAPSNRGGLTPQEAGKQGIGSGVARARDIAAGKEVDAKQVKAFFDRHQGNIDKAKAEGKTMKESKALQAEGLWGGQTMRRAAEAAVRKAEKD
jgi:hypothetical protein